MAKSFSTSALDLEKFKESMKDAAPAAKAVGVDVEKTTALLGTLSNAGISGSKAGTALKAGFIELNAAGISLDDGLLSIVNSENKLATATALVGKRAATSFLVLADGVKTTKELETGLKNAGGAAKKMADEQLDTLSGKTKILSSAWEGLVLSLLSGDGAFSSLSKSIIETTTGFLSFLTTTKDVTEETYESAKANRVLADSSQELLDEYEDLVAKGITPTVEEKHRLDVITLQLTDKLGDSVIAINKETGALELNTEAVKAQIKSKRFASDQEAATLASRLKGSEDEIKKLEKLEKQNNDRLELRRKINKETGATEQSKKDFRNVTKTGKILNSLNKEQLESSRKLDEQIIKTRENQTKLTEERIKAADLTAKLKELNFSQADVDALFAVSEPLKPKEGGAEEDVVIEDLIKTEKKKAKIKSDFDIVEDEEFDADLEKSRKEDLDELKRLNKKNDKKIEADKKLHETLQKLSDDAIAQGVADEEDAQKKADAKQDASVANAVKIATRINDALNKVSDNRISKIESEEEKTATSLERQERRAEQGLENNVAFYQKKAAELEKQKEDEAKKQERRAKVLAYFNLFSEFAKSEPNMAAFKAAAQVTVAETVSGLFYEGTEKVEDDIQGKPMFSGRDGYVVRVDGSERIMTGAQNSKLGGISNDDLVELATNGSGQVGYAVGIDTRKLESKLDSVIKAVQSNDKSVHWDSLGNRFETQIKNEVKKVTKHKKRIS